WPALDGHSVQADRQMSPAKNPAHKWRIAPVRRFVGAPGPLHKARPAAFLLLPGFRNIHSPNIRRLISLTVYRLKHGLNPYLEALLRLRHGLSIHPRGRVGRNLAEILPDSFLGDVMGQ